MKNILGVISIVVGVIAGIYAGLWWGFIGGIIQTVHAVQETPVNGHDLAWGICRIVFATSLGELAAFVFFMIGFGLLGWNFIGKRKKRF